MRQLALAIVTSGECKTAMWELGQQYLVEISAQDSTASKCAEVSRLMLTILLKTVQSQ